MMGIYDVKLGKRIDQEQLEDILIKAGKDMGWRVKPIDDYQTNFKLGSVSEEKVVTGRHLNFRGAIFPIMKIYLRDVFGDTPRDRITLYTEPAYGVTLLKREVKKFLEHLSKYVAEIPAYGKT